MGFGNNFIFTTSNVKLLMRRCKLSSNIFIAFLLISLTSFNERHLLADGNNTGWQTVIGGSSYEFANDFIATSDGGYIFTGQTLIRDDDGRNLDWDLLLIKTDSIGNQIWRNTYGGLDIQVGYSVKETQGGYRATGHSHQGTLITLVYEVETDFYGNLIWEKTLDEVSPNFEQKHVNTSNGGSINIQFSRKGEAQYLIKTNLADGLGDVQWKKNLRNYGQWASSVIETSRGDYAVMGNRNSGAGPHALKSGGNTDIYFAKFNSTGDLQWCKYYGGSSEEQGSSFNETPDGGFIIAGYTTSFGAGNEDFYVIKTDSEGNLLWQKTYGGSEGDYFTAMCIAEDGGIILAGSTYSFGAGESDIYLVRVSDYELPKAEFQSPGIVVEGTEALFDGSKSRSNNSITKYEWDFGDGSPHFLGVSSKHVYSEPGIYIVRLNVTDEYGNWGENSSPINIKSSYERLIKTINATLTMDSERLKHEHSLVVTLRNHKAPIVTGESWWLERYVNGAWKGVDTGQNTFISIGYYIPTGGSKTFNLRFSTDSLPNGLFRVGKEYSLKGDYRVSLSAYVVFQVTGSLVFDPLFQIESDVLFVLILSGLLMLSFLILLSMNMSSRASAFRK